MHWDNRDLWITSVSKLGSSMNKEVISEKKNLISIQLLNEEKFSRQNFSTLIEFS